MLTEIKTDTLHYFVDENNLKQGEYKIYYNNGQLYIHAFYPNDNIHGEFKSYYENGQLWVHAFYQNGKRHGEYKSYYRSGKLHINASFKNGKLYGVYKEYDTKENLRVHLFFHKGIKLAVCPNALSKCDLTYLMLSDKLPPKFSSTHFAFNNDNSSWYLQIVIPKSHNVFTIMVSRIHSIIPNLYFHIATPSYKPPFGSLNPLFLDQR